MRRLLLLGLAVGLALLGLGLLVVQWMAAPTTLRVAVGPIGSEDTRLVAAISQYLARERQPIRLKLVLSAGVAESAEALTKGKADLAVVRTDVAMPAKGQTVAIMHRDAALLVTPGQSGIAQVADLAGRSVGIYRKAPANARLLEVMLAHYEIPKESVTTVMLGSPAEMEEALRTKAIDAVLAVGTLSGSTVSEAVSAVTQAGGGPAAFIPVREADAIAQRSPALESFEVVRGAFGGTPPRPAETMTTLGVSHRLVAEADLDEGTISELTRLLFAMRPAISAEVPLANRIEGPDTSKSSTLPVHPGAGAYYEGEVETFFDRYGDWFYLMAMALGVVGSTIAGLAGRATARRRTRTLGLLDRLLGIVRLARTAEREAELVALEQEADEILGTALAKAGSGGIDGTGIAAFTLGLDQVRHAISDRRSALTTARRSLSQAAE